MECDKSTWGRVSLFWFSIGILLLLGGAKAENMTEPRANVNLSPIQQWRSAYECLLFYKLPNPCNEKEKLKLEGILDVNQTEISDYCNVCAPHTWDVLKCIHDVKRDFRFANGATVHVLNDTISSGCANSKAISTAHYTSSARKLPASWISFLVTAAFVICFM